MLSPSPSLPVACSEHGWHLPFYFPRGSHGRAALARLGRQREAEQHASTQHPIALRQLLLSNANRATTRPWEADSIMAWRKGSGREPSLPTRSRRWQVPVPCSAMGKHHEIELPGRAEQRGRCGHLPSKVCHHSRADGSWRPALQEPSLPALLVPPEWCRKVLSEHPGPQIPSPSYLCSHGLVPDSVTLCYLSWGSFESRLLQQLLGKGVGRKEGEGQWGWGG